MMGMGDKAQFPHDMDGYIYIHTNETKIHMQHIMEQNGRFAFI